MRIFGSEINELKGVHRVYDSLIPIVVLEAPAPSRDQQGPIQRTLKPTDLS